MWKQEGMNFFVLIGFLGLCMTISRPELHLPEHFNFLGLFWNRVNMSVSLLSNKVLDIQQLAYSFLQTQPITVCQCTSFLGKAKISASGHAQLCQLFCFIQSDMLNVYHSLAHLICSFYPSFSSSA